MLKGRSVAITRPAGQTAEMEAACIALQGNPVCFPLIRTVSVLSEELLEAVGESYTALVFTSASGVGAYSDALRYQHLAHRVQTPVFCVGSQTGRAAEAVGCKVRAVPMLAAAEHLPAAIADSGMIPGRALLIQGQLADTDLYNTLQQMGWQVKRIVGYETIATGQANLLAQATSVGEIQVLTFASGSAAQVFFDALVHEQIKTAAIRNQAVIASIGPKTTDVLTRMGMAPHVVAKRPEGVELIRAVSDYIEQFDQ